MVTEPAKSFMALPVATCAEEETNFGSVVILHGMAKPWNDYPSVQPRSLIDEELYKILYLFHLIRSKVDVMQKC